MPPESVPSTSISVGQVWEHHSTGLYTVYRLNGDGSVAIRPAHHGEDVKGAKVWQSYFRKNFKLREDLS